MPSESRYQLTIFSYPSEEKISDICELLYASRDKNLIASLSTVPYVIGRSFPQEEVLKLNQIFRTLKVGHRFQSLSGESENIEYDPNNEKKESLSQKKEVAKNSSFKKGAPFSKKIISIFFAFVILAGLIFGAFHFSPKFIHTEPATFKKLTPVAIPEKFDAKIERLLNDVEFRKSKDLLWSKAKVQLALDQKDGVRTFEDSEAVIQYSEGSRVIVKSNTLLIIGEKPSVDTRTVKLENGTISARIPPSEETQRLSIETPTGTLEMVSPKMGDAPQPETRIETKMKDGKLTVAVAQGTAILKPSLKDAKPIEIQKLQQLTATSTSVSAPVAYSPTLSLRLPANNAQVAMDPQGGDTISFFWENLGEKITYHFSVATDPEMKSILLSEEISKPELTLQYLDLGQVYWQVTSTIDGIAYKSEVRRLYVQKNKH
ncbi:MAG: FecR domain-containing protein [Deltaproteobacteria bacterium]|nr:FecR domain-containing protein [Deltaproteobacteria bacterium]